MKYPDAIDYQLEQVRTKYPQAHLAESSYKHGDTYLFVPGYELPSGWNRNICTVVFAAPTYNGAFQFKPLNGFWVDDKNLRLADGSKPQYAGEVPHIPGFLHWNNVTMFNYYQQDYDPYKDTLYTHLMVIRNRLKPAR
jgi:hypothetical protein